MKKYTLAFTLVELIVVITIVAILSTIGFVSYSGYTQTSRDTKRATDLVAIEKQMELGTIEGAKFLSFAVDTSSNLVGDFTAGDSYAGPSYAGFTGTTAVAGKYKAGNLNYKVLKINEDDFKDPVTMESYKIGLTTMGGNRYQIAATMEEDGEHTYIIGSYVRRTGSSSGSVDPSNNKVYILSDEGDFNKYKSGDKTWLTGTPIIKSVSKDGSKLYFNTTISASSDIGLLADEAWGLIKRYGSNWPTVEEDPWEPNRALITPYQL